MTSVSTAPFIDITPPDVVMRNLRTLPKAHMHIHLEATMRTSTLVELAAEAGVPVPQTDGFTEFTMFTERYRGLMTVLPGTAPVLRVIDEAVADAKADGVVYVEIQTSPWYYAPAFGGPELAMEAILDAISAAGEKYGVATGFSMTVDRTNTVELANATAALAVKYKDRGVVALGLAADERNFPAERFVDAFATAKAAGLQSSPHAGELVGPESVRAAIEFLKADRILHGVRAIEDPELVKEIAEKGIVLDLCPTSNLILSVIPAITEHPLKRLLDAGVRCSINADDPTLFGPSIFNEYVLCRRDLGLTDEELADCAWSSIEGSAAPEAVKTKARIDIDAWLANE